MSYDDFSQDFELELVDTSLTTDNAGNGWTSSKSNKSDDLNSQFFGNFGNSLTQFSNSVSASGDTLPYGVKAVWNGLDFTKESFGDVTAFSGVTGWDAVPLVTDASYAVGAGISTALLEGLGLDENGAVDTSAQVKKFAIVLDTGVAELDNYDLNVGKYASSKYIDSLSVASGYDLSDIGGMSTKSYEWDTVNAEFVLSDYYSYSQLLSASFLDYNYDGVTWDDDPFNDDNKHGTHVAGTIAAKADGKGVVGVAPGAEVISMKVLAGNGGGTFAGVTDAINQSAAYILNDTYTIKDGDDDIVTIDTSSITKENTVINMSLGAAVLLPDLVNLIEDYSSQGVVFSLAAGNSSSDVDTFSPAAAGSADNVYTVSAVDNKYNNAWFTNYDDDDDGDADDDSTVAGPGVNVLSYNQGSNGNGIGSLSGTSMAAPAIAGLLLMDPSDVSLDDNNLIISSDWSNDGPTNTDIGIQMGEDALPVGAAPYVDPFGLTTLNLLAEGQTEYDPSDPIEEEPETPTETPADPDSPWDGYDPSKTYYKTSGSIQGVNGTYSLSTGYGASQQSVLESDLSIKSGKLDTGLSLTQNDLDYSNQTGKKAAVNATEGSGVKLTGFAEEGDTVSFDYILASNDYIPYNDFSFVQLQTGAYGDTSANVIELSTLGAIGLDVSNFGTKTGSYSYTFKASDFGVDENGDDTNKGFFDLSVGVTDAIDSWVDTTLLVQALSLNGEVSGSENTFTSGEFTWNEGLGNAVATNGGDGVPSENYDWSMSTGSASANQAIIETLIGLDGGILDGSLSGTKSAINAQEGSAAYASAKAKIGDVVTFDWNMETNDYSPYNDFSFYSINDDVFKLAALGENIAAYGKAKGSVSIALTEDMFDMSSYDEEFGQVGEDDYVAEGGELVVSFGVMDALDWCVDSSLSISNLDLLSAEEAKSDADDEEAAKDVSNVVSDFTGFQVAAFGNYQVFDQAEMEYTDPDSGDVADIISSSVDGYITLSTQYTSDSDYALVDQTTMEFYSGMDSGTLDTTLDGTKKSINATSGSAVGFEGLVKAGDTISFVWEFETNDYVPYEDFAYFNINGDVQLLTGDDGDGNLNKAIVSGPPTDELLVGYFDYEITADDLDGLVGEALVSIGITNSLDNSVASYLSLYDFVYTSGDEYDTVNEEWSDEYDFFDVDYVGDVYGEMEDGFILSTGGDVEDVDYIEEFFDQDQLDPLSQSMVFDNEGGLIKSAVDATEGSAVQFTAEAAVGDKVAFWYYFETDDYVPFADFSFYAVGDEKVKALAGIGDSTGSEGVVGNVENWGWKEDTVSFIITEEMLYDTYEEDGEIYGDFDLTIGVVDALDTAVDSELIVGGLEILSFNENYNPDNDSDDYDEDGYEKPENDYSDTDNTDGEDPSDNYDEYSPEDDTEYLEPQLIGDAFFADDAVVLSTGGGSTDQSLLEDVLGIKFGDLDSTLNGTKESTNATEGSAAYTTAKVTAGDVVSFGYTFGTDDYIPFQDFSFVSINGKVANLATVGVECPDYGEISDVFNYVITEDDLGGEDSGLVQIAVGIVDSTDTYVDSYIELYDFSISDEEMVDDATGSGIIDGAGVFSINTATFETDENGASLFGGFDVSEAKAIKINFNGDSVEEGEGNYDIIASAKSTLSNNSLGYQILLEGTSGKVDGKYAVYQTDAYGEVLKSNKSGWKSLVSAVKKGWEDIFNVDLDNNSILTTEDNNLTVFSATKGAITIKEASANDDGGFTTSALSVSENNILAATPAKSEFNAFSTSSSTYQVLIGGSGDNAGSYQKWTANDEGIIIQKNETWFTGQEAATAGWENIFKMDFNSDGLLSGDTIYKVFTDNGPVVLKNFKGAAIEVNGDYGYDIVASKSLKNGQFNVVLEGQDDTVYADQWNIWKANSSGSVVNEGAWITTEEMIAKGLEQDYDQDFSGDGYKGEFDSSIGSDNSGNLGVALAANKFAMITSKDSDDNTILTNITQGKKGKNLKIGKNSTLAAAESFSSVSDLFTSQTVSVITNNKNKKMQLLTLDDNFKVVSKKNYKNNSVDYLKAEAAFDTDFNGDGITAAWDAGDEEFSGFKTLAEVVNPNAGAISLYHQLEGDGSYSMYLGIAGNQLSVEAFGGSLLPKFKSWQFDAMSVNEDADKVALFYSTNSKIKTILFDTDGDSLTWNNSKEEKVKDVKIGSSAMLDLEVDFSVDFNGDSEYGEATSLIYSNSDVGYLFKDTSSQFSITNDLNVTAKALTKGKKGAAYKGLKSYDFVAIDDDGTSSQGLLVHKKNGNVKLANFNSDGKLTGYNTVKSGTSEFYAVEEAFGLDIDQDSITGLDKSGDNSLGVSDLSIIESTNKSATYKDIAGTSYSYDSDTDSLSEIILDKQFAKLSKKGWSVIATESVDTDGDALFENYALAANKKSTAFKMYILGESSSEDSNDAGWNYTGDVSDIDTYSKAKFSYNKKTVNKVESIFNQNFDNIV